MRLRVLSAAALLLVSAHASAAGPVGLNGLLAPVDRLVSSVVTGLLGTNHGQLLVLPALPAVALPGLVPLPAVPIPATQILAGLDAIPTTVKLMQAFAPLATAVYIPVVTPIFLNF
ncbi:hypothetical protein DFR24_0808 [Panacagrimonas perspica]|uniref:Uncharacterized protein n=1 Tax=Panacagrimonas perspica TaxID=381431 RepID=A0A4R7PCT6_9GAMM|nr:hypothetical protein [Panacagrimonas perspica]TDU31439.1 hypothetical protein DFR24_0808 [Panacagrimonas perspica]THD03312.1 hypothetical protein B1810_12205 [Panacagrimonas perspica]